MKIVFFVNGHPRAGKDTTIDFMRQRLGAAGIPTGAFSSIDPVRAALSRMRINLDAKTEADRKLLATVGDALEEHSHCRSNWCVWNALDFFDRHDVGVFFLHVREPELIWRICQRLGGIAWNTVFVDSDRAERVTSNAADAGVASMCYDYTLLNNGTLDDLSRQVDELLEKSLPRALVQHSVE